MNKRKLLYSLGSLTTIGSIATLVSCTNPKKINEKNQKLQVYLNELENNFEPFHNKKSVLDFENIEQGESIKPLDFERMFFELPLLPSFNSLDTKLRIFLSHKKENEAQLIFKITIGLETYNPTEEAMWGFNLKLKKATFDEKMKKIKSLIPASLGKTFDTSLYEEKTVSSFQDLLGKRVDLQEIGIDKRFEEIKSKKIKISAKIISKKTENKTIVIKLFFEKYNIEYAHPEEIIVYGFKESVFSNNKIKILNLKKTILDNEKTLFCSVSWNNINQDQNLEFTNFTDNTSKKIKEDDQIEIEIKVSKKSSENVKFIFEIRSKENDIIEKFSTKFEVSMKLNQFSN